MDQRPLVRGAGDHAERLQVREDPGGPITGFVAKRSLTATKTDTPLIETPQSVSVVTREQLNDRDVQTLDEAIAYVPGVVASVSGFDPRADAFYLRGFAATYNGIFRDGLRQPAEPTAAVTGNAYAQSVSTPRSWQGAVDAFLGSDFIAEQFGTRFQHVFGQQKQRELLDYQAQVPDLDYARYLRTV